MVQIGQAALRDPVTGEFLPAVPLYIEDDDAVRMPETDLHDIGKIFAEKFKEARKYEKRIRQGMAGNQAAEQADPETD